MNEKNYKAHLAIIAANIIFGITPISKNILQEYLDPYGLTFFRMAGACLIFWVASLFVAKEKVKIKDLFFIFMASMFGIFINQFSFIQGLSMTSPVNAAIIITSTPIMTMLVSFLFLKEPITLKKAVGVFMGASGAILLVITSHSGPSGENGNILGDILCFSSSLSYAIYLTAFKWLVDRYHPITLMKWMFLFAALMSLPFTYNSVSQLNFTEIPLNAYLQILYIVAGATFITYLLIPIGQKQLRPTTLTMYNYIQPLVTTIIAVIFGIDTFGLIKTCAAIMIFSGVYVVMKSKSKLQADAEKKKNKRLEHTNKIIS